MNPLVVILVEALVKYGPDFTMSVIAAIKNKDATIEDVEKLFAGVRPYSAYNIPDKLP